MISDEDVAHVVDLLGRDVEATVGPGHLDVVTTIAQHQRQWTVDHQAYMTRVVDDVQQYLHDTFVDTTWPACPTHPHHPMWFHDGWWVADGRPIVALGRLAAVLKS